LILHPLKRYSGVRAPCTGQSRLEALHRANAPCCLICCFCLDNLE
jgi:hypothetical protein